MNEVGPIVVGEIVYKGKEPEGVMEPIDCLDAMFISSMWS